MRVEGLAGPAHPRQPPCCVLNTPPRSLLQPPPAGGRCRPVPQSGVPLPKAGGQTLLHGTLPLPNDSVSRERLGRLDGAWSGA